MCIDNGSRPGAEAIAIIHATNNTSTSKSCDGSPCQSSSPSRSCRILFSNHVQTPEIDPTTLSKPSTSYQYAGLSDLLPGSARRCEVWLSSLQFSISEASDESTWYSLSREIDLGVGEHGVIGRTVSLRCDGVEIGSGIMGWGDL